MMMLLSETDSNFISQRQSIFATNMNLMMLSEVFMVKEVDNISLRAKLVRNVIDRKSTRLNSSHPTTSRMPSSA